MKVISSPASSQSENMRLTVLLMALIISTLLLSSCITPSEPTKLPENYTPSPAIEPAEKSTPEEPIPKSSSSQVPTPEMAIPVLEPSSSDLWAKSEVGLVYAQETHYQACRSSPESLLNRGHLLHTLI